MEYYEILMLYIIIMSVITFIFYSVDKSRAANKKWRIKESTLLLLSALGGAVGGFIAMNLHRHKTQKWYFVIVNIAGVVGYVYLVYYLFTLK